MIELSSIGRTLITLGLFLVLLGGFFILLGHLPFLARLPGDIAIQRRGVNIYIPLASSLAVSIILTIIVNLLLRRR